MQLGLDLQLPGTSKAHYKSVYNERRFNHSWYLGKTGQGKSTALINAAIADILNGEGVAFFDPHGDAIDTILDHIPKSEFGRVVVFDPSDGDFPVGFNPLHNVPSEEIPFVSSALVDTFKSVWGYGDLATPQLDQYL